MVPHETSRLNPELESFASLTPEQVLTCLGQVAVFAWEVKRIKE
jgi:hypothetical protein